MTKKSQHDTDEKELRESIERGEWKSVKNLKQEMAKARAGAKSYQRKDARLNIRISSMDLTNIKRIAAYEGLPYQTLISSILHKYAAGRLDKNRQQNRAA